MSWGERSLAIESLVMLAAARFLVTTGREQNLIARLGGKSGVTPPLPSESTSPPPVKGETTPALRVGAMLERVARYTWWRSMCLEKALAGKWMLQRRGIPGTMYVGMAKQNDAFVAHAWLVSEGQTLTGAGRKIYATLAAFRDPQGSGDRRGGSPRRVR